MHALPQSSTLPQPSDSGPHSAPTPEHVLATHGVAPQRLAPAPPHTSVPVQLLQSSVPAHPSGSIPQLAFCATQVVLAQPHLLGTPLPAQDVVAVVQAPQSRVPPHPSETLPHSAPSSGHVDGVQPH